MGMPSMHPTSSRPPWHVHRFHTSALDFLPDKLVQPWMPSMHQMSRNALTQGTCRMERNCTFGIAMVNLSRRGGSTQMLLQRIWPIPTLAWTTMPIGHRTGSLFISGIAQKIGTSSGPSGTHPHYLWFEYISLSERLSQLPLEMSSFSRIRDCSG